MCASPHVNEIRAKLAKVIPDSSAFDVGAMFILHNAVQMFACKVEAAVTAHPILTIPYCCSPVCLCSYYLYDFKLY